MQIQFEQHPLQLKQIGNIDQFSIIQVKAEGGQGIVYKAFQSNYGIVAIKVYTERSTHNVVECLLKQYNIARQFNHSHIIKVFDVKLNAIKKLQNKNEAICNAIIMQYADGGMVFDYLSKTGRFSEQISRRIFYQLILGISQIQKLGYAHRDLKPQNLLFSNNFSLKIADFGLSSKIDKYNMKGILKSKVGTQKYWPPEFMNQKKYDGFKVDVFAAGVILFQIVVGSDPFIKADASRPDYKFAVQKEKRDLFWSNYQKNSKVFTKQFKDLFHQMIALESKDRPTLQQIKNSKWMKMEMTKDQQFFGQLNRRRQILQAKRQKERIKENKIKQLLKEELSFMDQQKSKRSNQNYQNYLKSHSILNFSNYQPTN